jgi:hypothetical protein
VTTEIFLILFAAEFAFDDVTRLGPALPGTDHVGGGAKALHHPHQQQPAQRRNQAKKNPGISSSRPPNSNTAPSSISRAGTSPRSMA